MPTRNIDVVVKLIGKGETSYSNARIYSSKDLLISLKIVNGQTTGGFGLGGTICPSLTAELHKTAVVAVGDKVKAELIVYNGGGNLTMASEFTVDNIKRKADDTLSVTALGNMIKLAKNYVSELTYPATQLQVLEEIAAQTGYELHPLITTELINNPEIQSAPVKGKAEDGTTLYYTRREILGYAAAINGGAAYIDQYGRIDIARHNDTGETFTHEQVFNESITEPFTVEAVKWSSTGLSYSLGDDYNENTIEFYNPLIYNARELIAHNLETDLIGFGYDGATIKKQGCGYFEVGDVVHYVDIGGTIHDLLILGIVYEFNGGYFTETLYSLASTATQREYAGQEVVSNQIGGGQAQPIAPSGALTEYEYISDSSVKYNGTTYSVEKNDNGIISKISDSNGNEFEPTISGEISDVILHNAVFWAVAMSRGIGANPNLMPIMRGVHGYFDYTLGRPENGTWDNHIDGGNPILLVGCTDTGDCLRINGRLQEYGYYDFGGENIDQQTIYFIAKSEPGGDKEVTFGGMASIQRVGESEINFWAYRDYLTVGTYGDNETRVSNYGYANGYSVMAVRKQNGYISCFGNGAYFGERKQSWDLLPRFTIGAYQRAGEMIWVAASDTDYTLAGVTDVLFVALSHEAHSDNEIITNMHYLSKRFATVLK